MTVSAFLDVFTVNAADVATTTYARTGYGFAPKGIIVWSFGRSDATDAGGAGTLNGGIGVASSTSRRWAETVCDVDDSDNNIKTWGVLRNDAVYVAMSLASAVIDGQLDVSAFGSDGVTFIIDDQFSADHRIAVFAFGGDEIENVEVGITPAKSGLGDDIFSNVDDFQPDFALFGIGTTADNTVFNTSRFGFGVASATDEQATAALMDAGTTSSSNTNYFYNAECISRTNNTGSLVNRAALTSFNASPGGVTINWIEKESTGWRTGWMMVKGGVWKVGSLQTRTDGNDIAVTGLASQPVGLMFFGCSKTWSTAGAEAVDSIFSFGAAVSTSSRHAQAWSGDNGEATAEEATFVEHDAVYVSSDLADGVRAIMDLKSIEATGFTCVMDDVDSAAVDVVYVALGGAASPDVTVGLTGSASTSALTGPGVTFGIPL